MPLHPPGPPTINVSGSDAAIVPVSIQPQTVPASYVTVRLTNGDSYYTAGGTSVSGGSVLTADQGSPNTIGNAWPVKITDGTNIYGSRTVPIHSLIASGGIGVGVSSVSSIGALRVDVVQSTGTPSGSLTGLLVGGLNVANSNPVPISDAGGSVTVDGTVTAAQGTAAAIGSPWPVIIVSGSDAVGTQTHPTWITGSVSITNQAGAGSNVTVLSGSLTGLLVGGVALSNVNPVPISDAGGSLTVDGTVVVTSTVINSGSVAGVLIGGQPASNANPVPMSDAGGSLTVDGTITATQGTAAGIASPWPVIIVSGSDPVGTQTHPTWITGSVALTNQAGVSANVTTQSGSVVGILIGGLNVANSNPIPISDAGGSLTVDGTVVVTSTAINSGSITGLLVGGVALSNANPAPISDAGGSITVDGTVTAAQGTAAGIGAPWPVVLVSGSNVVGSTTNPIWVTGSVYTLNPGAAGSNVTALSGSITGLLVGGLNVANSNPIPISDAGGSITVDGAVTTTQGTPASIGSPWPVILVSGSNVVGSTTNPIWVTGSVYTLNPGGAGSNVTALSGSITGLLVGGLNVANSNPVPISDSGGSITVDGTVTTTQGTAANINAPWPVIIVSGSDPVGTQTHPTWITGSVSLTNQAGVSANVTTQSGSITGLLVGGLNVANSNPVPISDAGGSITVDGTVTVTSTVINSGSVAGVLIGGQPATNANPVPISDAGGSITVDGTVTVASTAINSGSLTGLLVGGVALSNVNPVPISDAGGSITVDGTVTATVASTVINSGSLTGLLLGGVAASNANPIPISDAGGSLTVDGTVTTIQGTAASIGAPWPVIIVSGSDPVGTQTHPTWITGSVSLTNQAGGSANVTVQSGSITGLLVGGLNVANSNPVPISDAGGSLTIDGTVVATQGTPAAISSPWPVILVSGSDVIGSTTNPIWVTGSVYTLNPGAAGSNVTVLSGSVTGLLLGGLSVANNNPIPISDSGGSITVDGTVTVTSTVINSGSVAGILIGGQPASNANPIPISDAGGSLTIDGTVVVSSAVISSGSITGLLVGGLNVANSNPIPISDAGGSITVDGAVTATVASTVISSGSLTGLLVGGLDVANSNPIPISDAGGSVTVDGTVAVSSATISSGSITGLLIGGLNVANSNPVPISDAGGSITVDGTVTATVASTVISTGSITGLLVGGLNVANSNPVPISDAGGSLTVDGTVTVASGSVTGLLVGGVAVSGTNPVPAIAYDGMGAQWQSGSMREISYAFLNSATSGSTQIVTAQGAGIKITVLSVHVMTTSAVSVQFTSSGSSGNTNKTGFYPIAANGGFVLPHNPHGWFRTNANEHLCLGLSAAVFTAATITWMPSI